MFGDLVNVSVGGMLRLLSMHRQTGKLKVRGENGEGELFLEDGLLVGTDKAKGDLREEALQLLLLQKGFFHFEALESVPAKNRQKQGLAVEDLILESSRRIDPEEAKEYLPPQETVVQLAPIAVEREHVRLDLLRDEWNLLTRINGEDSLGLVAEKSELAPDRATQILYGLLSAGIIRKTRFKLPRVMEIANQELGNMGEALVRQAFRKLKIDQSHMRMKELIALLNELERSITLLMGPTRAQHVIGMMWEGSKR